MVYIRDVIVTPEQAEHIWEKHRVTPEEVDEVCFAEPWSLRGRDGSYACFGETEAGRYLVVFLYPRGRGVFAVATARDMTDAERRRYRQAGRR
ncbi:MAG TPA: BrnT family toxin [Chloroflexota bacterium]|jgi:hypothetical protein